MDTRLSERVEPASGAALRYLGGFANEHATEAVAGALPVGQNSPQVPPLGLYAEQISGTAFTAPRRENFRTWMYRVRPSAMHPAFAPAPRANLISAPLTELDTPPNRLRWDPLPIPEAPTDFVDGLVTIAANGDVATQFGVAAHLYLANRSMTARCFQNHDGELLIVPQQGRLVLRTELGIVEAGRGEIAVVPRGLKFRVELDGPSRGYVCENYGTPFRLPDLGPIGANGLANARDFLAPVAAPESELDRPTEIVAKFLGRCWRTELPHNPLDVVAWHGNLYPYKYDLARFMVVNTVSFDHPDPSIFTVLTAPSERPGTANVDFVIFPPRWMVAERTFRPPWFHRNVMSELMGLVHGAYDAKAAGFLPGGISLHNCMTAHGPDAATHARASAAELQPHYIGETLAFMFESRLAFRPTRFALTTPALQAGYDKCWDGFARHYGKDA